MTQGFSGFPVAQEYRFLVTAVFTGGMVHISTAVSIPGQGTLVSRNGPTPINFMTGSFEWLWDKLGREVKQVIDEKHAKDLEEAGQ